ncbi:protein ABHD1-like [Haemaphysalis longicornis]
MAVVLRPTNMLPRLKLPTNGEVLLCVSCAVYVVYYILLVQRKPRLVCRSGRLRRFLQSHMEHFVKSHYRVPVWCIGANMQVFLRRLYQWWLPRLLYRRQLMVLSDRGLVALDWLNELQPGPVLLLAGAGAMDSHSGHWRALLPTLADLGYPCVVMNGRGCGGLPLTTHRLTYAASVLDFAEVVSEVRKRYPDDCLVAVGMSLGGLLVSLYLSQWGAEAQVDAAVVVSPPFHAGVAVRALQKWSSNLILNVCYTRGLVHCLQENKEVVRAHNIFNAEDVFKCWTLSSFDKRYSTPVYGYQTVDDFYENTSLKGKLSTVQRPLVFLVAADDPLSPGKAIPEEEILNSPYLAALVTPRGGHLGFIDGWLWPTPPFFPERFVVAFAQALFQVCKGRSLQTLQILGD